MSSVSSTLVGSSPEVHVRSIGGRIDIRPIAGTRRRGATPEEDDALAALCAADVLSELGYEVCGPAVSGSHAMALAEAHRPDLVMMDIRLADDMDGLTAARMFRERFGIVSIFVIDEADQVVRSRANEAGHCGFVTKPYTRWQLRKALRDAVLRLPTAASRMRTV